MHDAYRAVNILEKFPLSIESITSFDNNLVVGTKEGHLVIYSVSELPDKTFEVKLLKSFKYFTKKPITQMAVVAEHQILIALSDNAICVYDMSEMNTDTSKFPLLTNINKTKGANLFTLDVKNQRTLTGEANCMLRMCVSVKRRLQLFYWKSKNFHDLQSDLGVPDTPKALAWCGESICVGFKGEYDIIKIENGHLKELFPTGKNPEPKVTKLGDNSLALGRDEMTIFIDSEGAPTKNYALSWTNNPIALEHDPPYIIAILPQCVEVRSIEPRLMIQSIDFQPKPKIISYSKRGQVYIASLSSVWCLVSAPISEQICQVLQDKQFQLALQLADFANVNEEVKNEQIHNIKNLFAFDLFCQKRFKESLSLFSNLETDPSQVIGLYPDLLPQDYRKQLKYPDTVPVLEGIDLENGLLSLIDYLTQTRRNLTSDMSKNIVKSSTAILKGNSTIESKKQLLQIVDTTLLKCYLQTNDALVAPLLRLRDNNCHFEESERALKKYQKLNELIILYQTKGCHRKALELLLKQAKKPDSPLKGPDKTVRYLQDLGKEHLDLIFEFATWVLKVNPENGLKIFIEDNQEVESLPRDKVLEYLNEKTPDLIIPYLEHVIYNWLDKSSIVHNTLVRSYKDKIKVLMKANDSPQELADVKSKLLNFLEESTSYIPEQLLMHFPYDDLFEERAILLEKLQRYEQALGLYIHVLKDFKKAENFCKKVYNSDEIGKKDVYFMLVSMYLRPPELSELGVMPSTPPEMKPNLDVVLQILNDYPQQIDPLKVLNLLPEDLSVQRLWVFLERILQDKIIKKRSCQILRGLYYSERLQVREQQIYYQSVKIVLTEDNVCRLCKKKIGNSAFARYPNGVLVHYCCCKDKNLCPLVT